MLVLPKWVDSVLKPEVKKHLVVDSAHTFKQSKFIFFQVCKTLLVFKSVRTGILPNRKVVIPIVLEKGTILCINNFSNKIRASSAFVGYHEHIRAHSSHDNTFTYVPGTTVTPKQPFNMKPESECASGIHFFFTKEEAASY